MRPAQLIKCLCRDLLAGCHGSVWQCELVLLTSSLDSHGLCSAAQVPWCPSFIQDIVQEVRFQTLAFHLSPAPCAREQASSTGLFGCDCPTSFSDQHGEVC